MAMTAAAAALIAGAVKGGLSAAGGAVGPIVGERGMYGRAYRKAAKQDIARLQSGELGLSAAEKQQMLGGAARAMQAQTKDQEAMINRQAAAQGGFGRSGASQLASTGLQTAKAEGAAQAAGKVEQLSTQKALAERNAILARLKQQRDTRAQEWGAKGPAVAQGVQTGIDAGMQTYGSVQGGQAAAGVQGVNATYGS